MEVVTESERPDLEAECREAFRDNWPEFIFHDAITKKYIDRTQLYFPRLDILLLDQGRVLAGGWGVALNLDGSLTDLPEGYDGALERAVEGREAGQSVNTLCLMAIAVSSEQKRRGLAAAVITALRERGGGTATCERDCSSAAHAQAAVPTRHDGAICLLATPRRTALGPLGAYTSANGRQDPGDCCAVTGDSRFSGRLGAVDRHGIP